jgi:hypothetical protein
MGKGAPGEFVEATRMPPSFRGRQTFETPNHGVHEPAEGCDARAIDRMNFSLDGPTAWR